MTKKVHEQARSKKKSAAKIVAPTHTKFAAPILEDEDDFDTDADDEDQEPEDDDGEQGDSVTSPTKPEIFDISALGDDALLTRKEAEAALRISDRSFTKLTSSGQISTISPIGDKQVFSVRDLRSFIASRSSKRGVEKADAILELRRKRGTR